MNQIPKTAYFYWSGAMPFLRYMTLRSFRKFNPSWRMEIFCPSSVSAPPTWSSSDQSVPDTTKEDFWKQLRDLRVVVTPLETLPVRFPSTMPDVTKSDLLRLYLLSMRGGLWSDMDILYFRSVETAFKPSEASAYFCKHRLRNDDGTMSSNPAGYHLIGFLMGAPQNPQYTSLYYKAMNSWNPRLYQSLGTFLYKHNVKMDSPALVNIPLSVVYPSNQVDFMFSAPGEVLEKRIEKSTIGWHWFGGNPIAGRYQNMLTSKTWRTQNSSIIVRLIQRIFDA